MQKRLLDQGQLDKIVGAIQSARDVLVDYSQEEGVPFTFTEENTNDMAWAADELRDALDRLTKAQTMVVN